MRMDRAEEDRILRWCDSGDGCGNQGHLTAGRPEMSGDGRREYCKTSGVDIFKLEEDEAEEDEAE